MHARTSRNRAIAERVAAGASLRTVATEFGITRQRVSQIHIHITGVRLRSVRRDSWPAERTARLRALLDEGLRPADIAPRLGVSRNAVIGKVYRLRREARTPDSGGTFSNPVRWPP
jgi:DNA-binding CsgD family transcriptional regulator